MIANIDIIVKTSNQYFEIDLYQMQGASSRRVLFTIKFNMDEKSCKNLSLPPPFQDKLQTSSLYGSPFSSHVIGSNLITSNSRFIRPPRSHLPFRPSGDFKLNFINDVEPPPKNEYKKRPTFHRKFNTGGKSEFFCDTCDRPFKNNEELTEHLSQHVKCWLGDCTFEGHIKIVERHIKMQHESGLIKRIGTLDTPEDIEKWREERKKNFPTTQRKEEKSNSVQNSDVKIRQHSFNRGKKRGSFNQMTCWPPEQMPSDWPFPKRRGRGQNRGNNRGNRYKSPRKGFISKMTSLTSEEELNAAKNNEKTSAPPVNHPLQYFMGDGENDDDDGPDEIPIEKTDTSMESTTKTPQLGALASLIADYASEDDEEIPKTVSVEDKPVVEAKPIFKRRKHESKIRKTQFRPQFHTRLRQTSLLEKLLAKDIDRERSIIFQCVQYIVKNNFFE